MIIFGRPKTPLYKDFPENVKWSKYPPDNTQIRTIMTRDEMKAQRCETVNLLIKTIGDNGHRFFYLKSKDRYARMEIDYRGRIWWIDDYSGNWIYTHAKNGRWKGFTHGGTLRAVVSGFRDFISSGKQLRAGIFGPWPEHYCNGDLWGYGDDMAAVRESAKELGIIVATNPASTT